MEYVYSILLLIVLSFSIYKSSFLQCGVSRYHLVVAFIIKVVVALIVLYYYSVVRMYGDMSDLHVFFTQAEKLFLTLKSTPLDILRICFQIPTSNHVSEVTNALTYWNREFDYGLINDNQTMIRLNLLIYFISDGNYWIHLIIFTFLAFVGLVFIQKLFFQIRPTNSILYFIALFYLPSSLIWSGGIFKESFLLFSLGGFLYYFFSLKKRFSYSILFLALFFAYFLIQIKIFFFIILLPICMISFVKINVYKRFLIFLLFGLVSLSSFFFYQKINENRKVNKDEIKYGNTFDLLKMIAYKQDDFIYDARIRNPNTVLNYHPLDGTFCNFVEGIPKSMFNFFGRPNIEFISNFALLPFRIENLLLWIFIVLQIIKRNTVSNIQLQRVNFVFIVFILCSSILLGSMIPVLGNLVKYRTPIMIMLFGLIFLNIKIKKERHD